jgi:hypothetical protein
VQGVKSGPEQNPDEEAEATRKRERDSACTQCCWRCSRGGCPTPPLPRLLSPNPSTPLGASLTNCTLRQNQLHDDGIRLANARKSRASVLLEELNDRGIMYTHPSKDDPLFMQVR